jgi:hypothetical protein
VLQTLAGLAIALSAAWIAIGPDNAFHLKRYFDMEVMESGYDFIWESPKGPDFDKYHREKRP